MSDLNEFEDAEGVVGLGMEREVQSIMETKMIQHNFQMQTKLYNKIYSNINVLSLACFKDGTVHSPVLLPQLLPPCSSPLQNLLRPF